jgi:tRNA pseudouridine13 synthase
MTTAAPLSNDAMQATTATSTLAFASGRPEFCGLLRQSPADFLVEEVLGFEPAGEGEHVFLSIEKTGLNTGQVAERLARLAKIAARQVSYAGMKDRHAVTRQWFSVHLPGKSEPDWQLLNSAELKVLSVSRHLRKLRRGVHKGNRFVITLTELKAADHTAAQQQLEDRIAIISQQGVPNYFGEQRFGHDGNNLIRARQWFDGSFSPKRFQRGIYLSAARSQLFNNVLARRVAEQSWNRLGSGELLLLNGTNSVFAQAEQQGLEQRLASGDIHLTGPMYGKPGGLQCELATAELEQQLLSAEPALLAGLEKHGLKAERRALRFIPGSLGYQLQGDRLQLDFMLPRGCFATALLRECIDYTVISHR